MIFVSGPSPVNSAFRPIEYIFDFDEEALSSVTDDSGSASFQVSSAFTVNPVVGDQIYVDSGTYEGYHEVTVVNSTTSFTTSTTYSVNQTSGNVKHILIPEIQLWSGYDSGEEYDVDLPLELIAEFTPVVSPDINISIDVSGFLQSIFVNIGPPVIGIDFSLFNRFRLYFDGAYDTHYQVIYSAILTAELNSVYFGTGVYLYSSDTPILFQCGKTILSLLDDSGVVVNSEADNGVSEADYYYDDYDSDDYFTQNS